MSFTPMPAVTLMPMSTLTVSGSLDLPDQVIVEKSSPFMRVRKASWALALMPIPKPMNTGAGPSISCFVTSLENQKDTVNCGPISQDLSLVFQSYPPTASA